MRYEDDITFIRSLTPIGNTFVLENNKWSFLNDSDVNNVNFYLEVLGGVDR